MSEAAPAPPPAAAIAPARFPDDAERVRALMLEYARWLDVDLCFQGFEAELAGLPGRYVPPGGGLWLARGATLAEPLGVVAMRALEEPGSAELKRLWVRPSARGLGLGRRLTETAIGAARAAGHRRLLLDTLPVMADAHRLYRALGFRETAPYYHNPIPGAVYLALELA